ncbi:MULTISPECIES: DEAD/DEAH box helicase family protein [unclassified Corynebacterium]|uniref:DEAD/DEAH box helicase family protein n=1 Tax=unclassified Corynebacterium TaxID=2624378 RepID=UPI001EF6D0AA|nr:MULTISPECIES: DEAD/DEAH box helicase family protein [unclassified Corynebacterium]MCG7259111.1 DEAD/DEAH box helicase family protein [Corynebacterium sp. ACRQK]MCG7263409.1 DEAD/DEAH box helicase family protein [Corynebacterium sp. ACRQL]
MAAPETQPQPSWRFAGTFRPYQQRILERFDDLKQNHRIHIVAAPGSGKTILGLELICRLSQPALILAPTITIRDQWIDRFAVHFQHNDTSNPREWCSTSLHNPAFLTVITYQALYSAYTQALDEETGEDFADLDILDAVRDIGTVCLDEAHHLRSQWHRALTAFMDQLGRRKALLNTIALTATPPYDSTPSEWQRYEQLCGPIDEEIFAPELVAVGNLCPHQDYVYVTKPSQEEEQEIAELRRRGNEVLVDLQRQGILAQLAEDLGRLTDEQLQVALDDEEKFYALKILLAAAGHPIAPHIQAILSEKRPELSGELGLQFVIDHPDFFRASPTVASALRANNLLNKGRISVTGEKKVNRILTHSAGKVRAVSDIAEEEVSAMSENLRMVILADYVQRDYLSSVGSDDALVHVGVIPIFEALRRRVGGTTKIAAISGSVIVIPSAALDEVKRFAADLDGELTAAKDLNDEYVEVRFSGGTRVSVPAITRAFQEGLFTILVGTAALLGEGWDSPCANALIIASSVRAFMLTNQMRGRVIRVNPAVPDKTANIWHIATCEPSQGAGRGKWLDQVAQSGAQALNIGAGESLDVLGSHDVRSLQKRFEAFVAPRADAPVIENGFDRCFAEPPLRAYRSIDAANEQMLARAFRRDLMRNQWLEALDMGNVPDGQPYEMQFRIDVEKPASAGVVPYLDVILGYIFFLAVMFGLVVGRALPHLPVEGQWLAFGVLALLGGAAALMRTRKVQQLTDTTKRLKAEATALARTLSALGLIETRNLMAIVDEGAIGANVRLSGGTFAERKLFADAMTQLSGEIRNARYLIAPAHQVRIRGIFCAQSVPDVLGTRRENVDEFLRQLQRVGLPMRAVYTRSQEGREFLLQARKLSGANIAARLTSQTRRYEKQSPLEFPIV